jgi:small-conductance mechanosensitive channel
MNDIKNITSIILDEFAKIYLVVLQNIPEIIFASITLLIFIVLSRYIRTLGKKFAQKRTDDILVSQFIGNIVATCVIILGVVIAFNILGINGAASEILAGIGITGFIIGFAFKDIGENFIAGVILAFKRPFDMGDIIETNGLKGSVVYLTLRETTIKTFDGKDIYVPNSLILRQPLQNYSKDDLLRHDFSIGVDYDEDIDAAIDLIYQAINVVDAIEKSPKVPTVFIEEFAANSINIRIHFWLNMSHNGLKVKSAAMNSVLKTLNSNGFYIPTNVVEHKDYKGLLPRATQEKESVVL